MPLIARVATAFVFLLLVLPSSGAAATGSRSCSEHEFWRASLAFVSTPDACCLPIGGPTVTPPTPPRGTTCPPSTHYWSDTQGCCVPRFPSPVGGPAPQCPKYWDWNHTVRKCDQTTPTTSQPSRPEPSSYSEGSGRRSGRKASSSFKSRSVLCPAGLDACPISGAKEGDFECLDTYAELESCGGCVSLGSGQDCTTIPGAWNVGCERGSCIVYSCASGFKRAADGNSCVSL